MTVATRVGWCPGALKPMQSGDGLLVRVKPHGGTLSFDQAEGLSRLAVACGNSRLDLTGRANLQIRGVSAATLDTLHRGLDRLGLLDPDPEVEAVRNIVASPLASLDPAAAMDIRPVVAALEQRLATDPIFRRLPPKWNVVVDDGGALGLDDVAADVRFVFSAEDVLFIRLGDAWASVPPGTMLEALSGLARFTAAQKPARMRDLVHAVGPDALFAAAGLTRTDARPEARPVVTPGVLLGAQADGLFVGTAPPFGSLGADDLSRLVAAARQAGADDVRLTPWRVLLVTFPKAPVGSAPLRDDQDCCSEGSSGVGKPSQAALHATFFREGRREACRTAFEAGAPQADRATASASLARELGGLGMITDGSDPRLQVVACTGAPGCHRATVPTRRDAARLARVLGPGTQVHVSGCAKGCARAAATPWTLVGRNGCYDLVRDGAAGDAPLAQGLSFNAAAAWVRGAMQVNAP